VGGGLGGRRGGVGRVLTGQRLRELLNEVEAEVKSCRRCSLWRHRRNPVFGEGNPETGIVLIGEAPGRSEDLAGRPFVGAAGKVLDRMLSVAGLSRTDVYITNVLKCRPPGNRDPRPEEVEACTPYLDRQLRIIRPRVVVTLGRHALSYVLRWSKVRGSVSRLHGTVIELNAPFGNAVLVPLYHPAVLLYRPAMREVFEEDARRLGKVVRQTLGVGL